MSYRNGWQDPKADEWINRCLEANNGAKLSFTDAEVKELVHVCRGVLMEQAPLIELSAPIKIVGTAPLTQAASMGTSPT